MQNESQTTLPSSEAGPAPGIADIHPTGPDLDRTESLTLVDIVRTSDRRADYALLALHDRKGYEAMGFKKFGHFLKKTFTQSRQAMYARMQAASVRLSLVSIEPSIDSVPQRLLQPLYPLIDEHRREAWKSALEVAETRTYPEKSAKYLNGKVTAKIVEEVALLYKGDDTQKPTNEWTGPMGSNGNECDEAAVNADLVALFYDEKNAVVVSEGRMSDGKLVSIRIPHRYLASVSDRETSKLAETSLDLIEETANFEDPKVSSILDTLGYDPYLESLLHSLQEEDDERGDPFSDELPAPDNDYPEHGRRSGSLHSSGSALAQRTEVCR